MRQTEKIPDVLIIGAGVIGCAVAYYAAKAGLRVVVLDSHRFGGQASHVAAGLIAPSPQLTKPSPFATIALASVALFPTLHAELLEQSGIDFDLRATGTLRIATTSEQAAHQQKRLPKQQKLGLDLTWLTPYEIAALEPSLTRDLYGGVYGANESQVTTSKLLAAYIKSAENLGATFVRVRASGLVTKNSRVIGVETPGGTLYTGHVVIAGGAWTQEMGSWLRVAIPISPERGQIVSAGQVSPRLRHIVFGEQIYLAPKRGGVIIGAIKDSVGFIQQTTIAAVVELLTKGTKLAPNLANSRPRTALAGLRPHTPDGCPIIGSVPDWQGISIASGHNSNGLLLRAITGQLITAQLTNCPEPVDSGPYHLQRFARQNQSNYAGASSGHSRNPQLVFARGTG